jgi:DNA-binding NarL/FixJ family response regulator
MPITILVVEDFFKWQEEIRKILEFQCDLNVVATAACGLEAIQRAQELKPNIILMDVNLPDMNGFEVLRHIHESSPVSKVLFLSEERGLEFIKAAFKVGGSGYILKSDSQTDLLTGIRAILRGEQFISRSLADWRNVSNDEGQESI